MPSDYDCYLLGCRYREETPLSRWRFAVAYASYGKMLKWSQADWHGLGPKRRNRFVLRWYRARKVAGLVKEGQRLAAQVGFGEDDAGTAGAGDREPRVPLAPVLAGCAARALPRPDDILRTELWS